MLVLLDSKRKFVFNHFKLFNYYSITIDFFWFREKKIKEKQNQQETQNPDLSLQTSWLTQINVSDLKCLYLINRLH